MKTAIAIAAAFLLASPVMAAKANPAASLSPIPPQAKTSSAKQTLPVPGYKIIAGVILAGIGGVLFAFTQQDGAPDSN